LIFEPFPNAVFVYIHITIEINLKTWIVISNYVRFKRSMMKSADGFTKQSDNSISLQIKRFTLVHSLFTILSLNFVAHINIDYIYIYIYI